MDFNYCSQLERRLDNEMRHFEDKVRSISDPLNKLGSVSLGRGVNSEVKRAENSLYRNRTGIEEVVRDNFGSCFDALLSEAEDFSEGIDDVLDNMQDALGFLPSGVIGTTLKILSAIKVLYKKLGIGPLLGKIDSYLGCLSESNCNISGNIQNYIDRLNQFPGFSEDGFNFVEFAKDYGLGDIVNIQSLENLSNEVEDTYKSAKTAIPTNLI